MDNQELRQKMMTLWKNTFHDSDTYIKLVFDNYFDPEYVEYYEENGKLISALLSIPYTFKKGKNSIQGLYLCGLATLSEYRHHGIMTQLIDSVNKKAKEKGYAFSFLIPASDLLQISYYKKGYENAMFRVEDRYTDVHDFDSDYRYNLFREDERVRKIKEKYFEKLKVDVVVSMDEDMIPQICDYIAAAENNEQNYVALNHSEKDRKAIIFENIISGGKVLVCQNTENKITGVLFATFDDRKRIIIPKVYHDDNCSYFRLLDKIKNMYPELSMSVYCYPEETERRVLWSMNYGAASPEGGASGAYGVAERVYDVNRHARPYGMAKILNVSEILKFLANDRSDCKFSILVKEGINQDLSLICHVANGKAKFEEILTDLVKEKITSDKSLTVLSNKNFAQIIFRRKDSNSLIMEALGIPRLGLNMSLMLD